MASRIRAQIKLGNFGFEDDKPVLTFGEYADSWIKTTVPATCKQSTVRDYNDILRIHVRPVFESLKITDVTRGKIKDFLLGKINDSYSKSTVSHLKDVVSGVLNKALDNEAIPANPALSLGKIIKREDKKASINAFSADELKDLLDTVSKSFPEHYTLFLSLARTGVRIGEALALKWEDVDFKGRFIEVKRSIVRGSISTPKSGKSRRVDMSLQLTEVLKAHRRTSKKKGFALGLGCVPDLFLLTRRAG